MSLPCECQVCWDPLRGSVSALKCGHLFHAACIDEWFAATAPAYACPHCRHRTTKSFVVRHLFLPEPWLRQPQGERGQQRQFDALRRHADSLERKLARLRRVNQDLRLKLDPYCHHDQNKLNSDLNYDCNSDKADFANYQHAKTNADSDKHPARLSYVNAFIIFALAALFYYLSLLSILLGSN